MTTPSGGTGIAINTTPVPYSDTDLMNAGTENAKQALGLILDSLKTADISFVEHRSYGYDNRNPGKPALSHPIHTTRLAAKSSQEPLEEERWQRRYEKLLQTLPKEIKAWLEVQLQIPYTQRAPEFHAFHFLLVLTAKALVWLDQIAAPLEAHSAELERAEQSLLFPYIATARVMQQGKEIIQRGLELLHELGPNDPNYDKLLSYFSQTASSIQTLESILRDLAQDIPPPNSINRLNRLINDILLLKEEYHHTDVGENLRLLGPTINSLALSVSALTAGYGPASVLWTLALSRDDHLTEIQAFCDRISGELISNSTEGERELFSSSLQMLLIIASAMTRGVLEDGIASLPKIDPHTDPIIRAATLDAILQLLTGAGVLSNITSHVSKMLKKSDQEQHFLSDATQLILLTTLPFALEKKGDSIKVFNHLNKEISALLHRVSGKIETRSAALYLQQAKIALEHQHFAGFCDAYKGLLESYHISPKSLDKDFETIGNLGKLVTQAIKKSPEDPTNRLTALQIA